MIYTSCPVHIVRSKELFALAEDELSTSSYQHHGVTEPAFLSSQINQQATHGPKNRKNSSDRVQRVVK